MNVIFGRERLKPRREREREGCYGREGATTAVTCLGTWGASVPSKETMDIYEGRVAPSNWGTHLNAVCSDREAPVQL